MKLGTLTKVTLLAIAAFCFLRPAPLAAGEHVRVILDVSGSMKQNDPGRRVILATVLLYDLAAPNPTLDDSFEILPFDRDWRWQDPGDPPPESRRERIQAGHEDRRRLLRELSNLDYDASKTYFYPGLAAAIADLEQTPEEHRDVRTIVLVTDGVPEPPTRDREAELIRSELVPRLEEHGIRLYVLAFSDEARRYRDFLEAMVRTADGRPVGELFLDPEGEGLLRNMLGIFARSFGYSPGDARRLPGVEELDLEAGSRAERVAVVVHTPRPEPPSLRLSPPSGAALNAPDGVVSAGEPGGSYALTWVLSPAGGEHGFASDAGEGSVAVLRPSRLQLELLPAPPHTQTELAMAQTPFHLKVRVRSPVGELGDPGPVELSFRPLGERRRDVEGGDGYSWRGDRGAPPAGPGEVTEEGRVYPIAVEFPENQDTAGEVYVGHLELEARRGEAVVGSRIDDHAHRVEVYPYLALAPLPLTAYAADRALDRNEEGCTSFDLTLAAGELPHPGEPVYSLRAVLDPPDPEIFERELRGAFLTLDGVPLTVEGRPGTEVGGWYKGRRLDREELLAEHELCLRLGEPTRGDPGTPVELPLRFTLLESPYDDFRVIDPFTVKVAVVPPGTLDRWRPLLALAGISGLLLAALWYLRDRPGLPPDLRCAVGRAPGSLEARNLAEGPLPQRLLGLTAERPITTAGGETVAWLRPAPGDLYRLRPAPGTHLLDEAGRPVPTESGLATVDVHRPYRLQSDRGSHLLRVEFG
jgi:hypothetical protein